MASAPAIFQKLIHKVLLGLEGVLCYINAILVSGGDKANHFQLLDEYSRSCKGMGSILNRNNVSSCYQKWNVWVTKFRTMAYNHSLLRCERILSNSVLQPAFDQSGPIFSVYFLLLQFFTSLWLIVYSTVFCSNITELTCQKIRVSRYRLVIKRRMFLDTLQTMLQEP